MKPQLKHLQLKSFNKKGKRNVHIIKKYLQVNNHLVVKLLQITLINRTKTKKKSYTYEFSLILTIKNKLTTITVQKFTTKDKKQQLF